MQFFCVTYNIFLYQFLYFRHRLSFEIKNNRTRSLKFSSVIENNLFETKHIFQIILLILLEVKYNIIYICI